MKTLYILFIKPQMKEEGRRKREEGRRKKEEGRRLTVEFDC
ncbi:hypothetical protein [Microcoleus asticus]|nr:hypothetical protein [Microcoleus asticus]